MKVKKLRRHRKAIRFYSTIFGFRQPYKVLCDGTFVRHLIVNHIAPADTAVSNILGGPVKLFTTRCCIAELKRECKSHPEYVEAAQQLMTARCPHEDLKRADLCIEEIISGNNPEHFFVATQDADMRRKFQQLPGVPLIFGLRNALFLEPPSKFQHEFAKSSEEERLHVTELERKMIKKRTLKHLAGGGTEDSSENEGSGDQNLEVKHMVNAHKARKGIDIKDRPQFKRKRPKAPNPLSCLPKKKRENQNPSSEKDPKGDDSTGRNRSRKRRRSRKGKKPAETESC